MPEETVPFKVIARCRPLTEDEESKGCKSIVSMSGDKTVIQSAGKDQSYVFDNSIFWDVKSSQIFQESCEPLLQRAFNGYNVTIMALGATGSGKSYLMSGIEGDPGIIPCLNKRLFQHIKNTQNKEFFITISFVEILDEEMTDILNPHNNPMKLRQHAEFGIYVDGLSQLVAKTEEDLSRLYEQGNRTRKMGGNDLKTHRTRSHGIFTIHIEQRESGSGMGIKSTINLVDFAGIEGAGNQEGNDRSVRSLCDVLESLGDAKKKGSHVPYRNSKITRLLQDSFGGNSLSLLLATISPADKCLVDTQTTMKYAMLAKNIKNQVKINVDETRQVITDLRQQIAHLRTKLTSGVENKKDDVLEMEELIRYLQVAKRQTWAEKQKLSNQYEEERKTNLANKGILNWVMDTMKKGDKEMQERTMLLQKEKDQLSVEYKEKRKLVDEIKDDLQARIAEYSKMTENGNATDAETKTKVTAIHDQKERLKKESEAIKDIKCRLKEVQEKQKSEKDDFRSQGIFKGNAELRQMVEAEERKKLEAENKMMIAEAKERAKMEVEQRKMEIQLKSAEGKHYSTAEAVQLETRLTEMEENKTVVALQLQCLEQEKEQLRRDLEEAYRRHKEEMEIQKLQHFQTFRSYREMFEEQKATIEQRFRGLLEESIQDAVFLSSRNSELVQENQAHKQEIAEMKDKLSLK